MRIPPPVNATTAPRVWLDVPFADKDEAKAAGARWDPRRRRWWAPPAAAEECTRWHAAPPVPYDLPGEDRTLGGTLLYVDLIPSTSWYRNVRSALNATDWDRVRRMVYARAGHRCEVCAAPGRLEAHERFTYSDDVQSLRRLLALCAMCHTATHLGLAQLRGQEMKARAHLARVNQWSVSDVDLHIEGAVELWYARSRTPWRVDLTVLAGAGVTVHTATLTPQEES